MSDYNQYLEFMQIGIAAQSAEIKELRKQFEEVYSRLNKANDKLMQLANFSYHDYLTEKELSND